MAILAVVLGFANTILIGIGAYAWLEHINRRHHS